MAGRKSLPLLRIIWTLHAVALVVGASRLPRRQQRAILDIYRPRFWRDTDLSQAQSVVNLQQLRPFIEKLEAGLPVTVLALGDSITCDYAGTFHRDM